MLHALAWALLLAPLLFSSCRKPIAEAPVTEPAPEAAVATPTPATPMPKVVEATPAPNYLAPTGVFFLVTQVSVETPSGITGLRPGTQVQQTGPNEFLGPEGHKLTLRPDQVTNDLRIAQQIAGADAATQAALRRMSAPPPPKAPTTAPAASTQSAAPAAASPPQPSVPTSSLGGSSALGASHTRVKDGFVWQKNSEGVWIKVRPSR
jgi:hypothetical protein